MDGYIARHEQGFSLIEIVIVIVVMGILGIAVTMQWSGTSVNIGAQAYQLANDIRYTQSLAMTSGQRYYLIKQSSTTYQILSSAGVAESLPMGNTTVTLSNGITFGTLTNLPNNLIAFDGKGTPYITSTSPGTALATSATIPLVAGSKTATVTILAGTGRASVS